LVHVSGIWHVLYGMSRGAGAMITPQFQVDDVLRWLQSGRIQHAMLITSMVIALLEHPQVRDSEYQGLRSIMYGGAPMPPSVIREMSGVFNCDLYNGFGAGTEAAGQAMFRPADHRRALAGEEHLLGSIGRPIYGVDIKLCDADGKEVAPGDVGEIYSRGDSVMSGYLNQPEKTAKAIVDGWFHGGDLAWRDPEGFLFLAGRADDMIIRGGENVYPVEIEDVVSDHASVVEVAVVGEPDPFYGETVTAVVRLTPGSSLSIEDLDAHCRGRLGGYKIPSRLVVVEDMPRSQTGKIQKGVLRQRLRTGELT
jgi:acyl-CoA synthetase (AMP-forming)/AMP-acid ligase II